MAQKKTITKSMIMKVWGLTLDTQPFYSTMGLSHSERIIRWFELNDFNITQTAIKNVNTYIKVRKEISQQVLFSLNK